MHWLTKLIRYTKMPKLIDLNRLRTKSIEDIKIIRERIEFVADDTDYLVVRWMCAMSAVDAHGVWERFVERRLTAALNHNPSHFINEYEINGVKRVPSGLASYVIRGGGKYFDFRSMSELIGKADGWLGKANNPFRRIQTQDQKYIDALAAVRNCTVHGSDAANAAYRRHLTAAYGVRAAPRPDEFLKALDYRAGSPERYKPRLFGLLAVLSRAIQHC